MTLDVGRQVCAKCTKSECVTICYGCQRSFCSRHFHKHRIYLCQQMEDLHQKQENFQKDLNQDKFEHSLLTSIYTWERKSMRKIQEIAEQARMDLHQWMEKTKIEVQTSLQQINEQMESSKKLDNYTELDFARWIKQLEELRNSLEKPSTISIEEDDNPSSSIRTIKLINKQSIPSFSLQLKETESPKSNDTSQEHFVTMFGPCKLSEDDHVVTHASYRAGLSQTSGTNQYSVGKHSIPFQIENKGIKNIFIGITSSSHKVISPTFDYSVHGWWNFDHFIVNGESKGGDNNENIQIGDKITLTIDCDHQQIELKHHPSERQVSLPVNLEVCPFPWRILVRLLAAGDAIRILC